MDVIPFLKAILVDAIRGNQIKVEALELYTELITKEVKEEHTGELTFNIPFAPSGTVLTIHQRDYDIVKGLAKEGLKINAIKHLRMNSWINGNKNNGGPSLKESKDFVEQHNW
jgi:hypothetical protein